MTNDIDLDDLQTYFDAEAFQHYREAIEARFAKRSGELIAVADIHKELGEHARREWTLDALHASMRFYEEPCTHRLAFRVADPKTAEKQKYYWNGRINDGLEVL